MRWFVPAHGRQRVSSAYSARRGNCKSIGFSAEAALNFMDDTTAKHLDIDHENGSDDYRHRLSERGQIFL
jgi:hypothetical protein